MIKDTSYGDLANVYDLLTDDVEYTKRTDYIEELICKHLQKKPELLCDLGCGTGTICSLLAKRGYDCIGIDISPSMLNVAQRKNQNGEILFLNQDICEFELFGTVDVFTCMLDTLNYVTDSQDVARLFKLVNNYLNPGGIFIFDVNSLCKFREILADNSFVFEKDNVFYTWENYYEDELLDLHLNFFLQEENGKYTRFTEEHQQKYHSYEFICECAQNASLNVEGVYGDLTFESPKADEERIFYVLKKI